MADDSPKPIRTLFCMAVQQNFFDLPWSDIGVVWKPFSQILAQIKAMPGVTVFGTLDDDETMVGTSPTGFPWTAYILADMPDRASVVAACNLFRSTEVGEYRLWKYIRVEARMGREIVIPPLD
ncbi:MAG: hypothetical protein AAGH48_09835 [Pseudomonadota bacterium]